MASDTSSDIMSDLDDGPTQQSNVDASTSQSNSDSRKRHGEKKAFQAPSGYVKAAFSNDLLDTFASDKVSKKSNKQLWCVKLPDGISPAQLDGLKIGLPSARDPNEALAHLVIERAGRGGSTQSFEQKYLLHNRRSLQELDRKDDVRQSSMTQLIAMAGGNAGLQEQTKSANDEFANEEMESFQVLLPERDSEGRYVIAPTKISQYMQLVIESPVQSTNMTGSSDANPKQVAKELSENLNKSALSAGTKRTRSQPWDKLTGFFSPAGSRTDGDEENHEKGTILDRVEESKKSKRAKKDHPVEQKIPSPEKKAKKKSHGKSD